MASLRKSLFLVLISALLVICSSVEGVYEVSSAGGCSSPDSHPDAYGFYNELRTHSGWSGHFYRWYGNCQDYQYQSSTAGGHENSYIDNSDIHYHVSHGGTRWDDGYDKYLRAVIFENGDYVPPSEAYSVWGDWDLEWIGFRCCRLLNDNSRGYWANAMDRLHLLLGFKTSSYKDDDFGWKWAWLMKDKDYYFWPGYTYTIPGQTVTQAWFTVSDITQPTGVVARVLAETPECYDDYLWGEGSVISDPIRDNYYYYWDHTVGSEYEPLPKSLEKMIIYEISEPAVGPDDVNTLAQSFGMKPEKVVETRAGYMAFEETEQGPKVLQIFGNSGHYYFQDIGKLWKFSEGVERYPPKLAESRTTSFLQERGLYPEDTGPWSVESEEISEVESRSGEVRTTHYQGTCTVYTRVKTASGNTSTAVYGPGGRMKVYIYEDGQIMGALGNWRDVNYKEEVSSMNAEDAWLLFEKYGRAISVAPIYADYEGVETNLKDAGQAYYEASPLKKQAILTPVWVFDVNFVTNEQVTDEALVYIPVSQDLFPPLTEITSPDDGAEVNYGETVDFSCQTLSGFGTPPFTYNWESSVDGFLSNEQNFKTSELSVNCPAVACDCSAQPHMITLKVRDAYGTEFTTSVQLTVKGPCPDCMHCADLNTDGLIDLKDFARLAGSWLTERGSGD